MLIVPRVIYEFGPFRVDPEKHKLLRDGHPVAITHKALETLTVLLRHAGEDVTREQLIEELWPDSFVEEANLSQNIFMLRKVLGDTPEDRRFIVTLPGRGYRFAGKVNTISAEGETDPAAPADQPARDVPHAKGPRSTKRNPGIRVYMLSIGAAAVAGVVMSFFIGKPRVTALGKRDAVLISEFTNKTGDAVFDDTLRQGIAVQLAQSPVLTLVSEDRIEQTLGLMGKPTGTPLTPQLARQVCERTGSAVLLEGSVSTLGTRYVVGMVERNCRSGDVLDEEQEQVTKKEDILNAVTQIARRFRTHFGESQSAIERHDTPLAEATTPSLDALKAYSAGIRKIASESDTAALPFFQRATEIDPDFAMAYAFQGRVYGNMGEAAASEASTTRAYELRNRASDRERFWITSAYDMQVTENLEKAQQTCMVWEQSYPRDVSPYTFMAGVIDPVLGKYDQSIDQARKALEIDPSFEILYYDVAVRSADIGRMQDADDAIRFAFTRGLRTPDLLLAAYDLAFLKHDQAAMERIEHEAEQDPLAEEYILQHKAFVLANLGRLTEAGRTMQMASDAARRAGEKESIALNLAGQAVWEALAGKLDDAKHHANVALTLKSDRAVEYGTALALVIAGDSARAQSLANDLSKRFPEDTSVQMSYLPVLRARIALNQGDAAKAIGALEAAIPYELGTPRSAIHGDFGALYPIYFRGEAFLAARKGAEAAQEFQKILDHPGIVGSDTIGGLAKLQQARAFAMQGDVTKTRAAYGAFLAMWKDADSNVPVLRQAHAELNQIKVRRADE